MSNLDRMSQHVIRAMEGRGKMSNSEIYRAVKAVCKEHGRELPSNWESEIRQTLQACCPGRPQHNGRHDFFVWHGRGYWSCKVKSTTNRLPKNHSRRPRERDSLFSSDRGGGIRGTDEQTAGSFSYVSCEARVPAEHPLRLIRAVVDEMLDVLSPEFERLYANAGRPEIAPEKLLRALLLQAFYSIRSERQLIEQLDYNLLFRWFVGLTMDAPVWDARTFSKNRDQLLDGEVAHKLLAAVVALPRIQALISDEHFSVDGTLIQTWASHKPSQPKLDRDSSPPSPEPPRRNAEGDWHGQKRSNDALTSSTDPDVRLARMSDEQSSIPPMPSTC